MSNNQERSWHSYITEAEKTDDAAALRKIVGQCARELFEAEQRIAHLERQAHSLDRRAETAAAAIAELAALLPEAKAQAKKGKPALLRMILRASR